MSDPTYLDTGSSNENIDIRDERIRTEPLITQSTEDISTRRDEPRSVRFYDQAKLAGNNPISMPSGSASLDPKLKKKSYGEELKHQMRINQEKRLQDLQFDRDMDLFTVRSRIENDPFGRPGAGAPKRDEFGRIVATKPKKVFSHDPRNLLNGNEDIPTKPHNLLVNNFEPVPKFSLKAQMARNNLANQPLSSNPSLSNIPSKPFLSPQGGGQFKIPEIQTQNLAQSVDFSSMDSGKHNPFSMYSPQAQMPFPYPYPPYGGYPFTPSPYPYNPFPQQQSFPSFPTFPTEMMSGRGPMQSPGSNMNIYTEMEPPTMNRNNNRDPSNYSPQRNNESLNDISMLPYPANDNIRESLAKEKSKQKYLENQRELLIQIEERKRLKEEETRRKKEEEAREEERLRREQEALASQEDNEVHNRRNLKETVKGEDKFRASRFKIIQDPGATQVSFTHNTNHSKHGKRQRTPIELYEARKRIEDLEKQKVIVESKVIKELPIEVEKSIHHTIESELTGVRKDIITQQQDLHDNLLELKKQIITTNKERVEAQREIDELKYQFKQQQVQEEIRRTELYNAMMKSYTQPPSILPTVTKIELDKELTDPKAFEFPMKPHHMRRIGYSKEEKERDILDYLLSNTKMVEMRMQPEKLVNTIDDEPRPDSAGVFHGAQSGMKYLSYFNTPDMNLGIKVDDDRNRYDIPDDIEEFERKHHSEDPESVYGIMSKNKKRIEALEEIEQREKIGRFDNLFTSPPSDYYISANTEDQRSLDPVGDLLEKINNPRKYMFS